LKAEVSKEALLKEEASKKIPPLTDTDAANLSVKEMAKYLKSLKSGK
jgi:hypothetical protein